MNKIEKFMEDRGKPLKPARDKKDSNKLTGKEKDELILQMLEDFGYIK